MKKFIYRLSILFISACFLSNKAETLFYKDNNAAITQEEHDTLYDIKLHYQFPMSTAYGNCPDNEIEVIQHEINKKSLDIQVAFIPTTMYELLFMHFLETNKENLKCVTSKLLEYDGTKKEYSTKGLERYTRTPSLEYPDIDNQTGELKQCHYNFNAYVVNFLKARFTAKPKELSIDDYKNIIADSSFLNMVNQNFFNKYKPIPIKQNYVEKIILKELQAHEKNQFLLYRGTSEVEKYPRGNQSLSFGNSLFAGYIFDRDATAYFYFSHPFYEYAYLLPINKNEYCNGKLKEMFHIPPLITIASLVGEGECFHARSRILPCDTSEVIQGILCNDNNKTNYFTDSQETYKQIFHYIQKNHLFIKKKTNFISQTSLLALGSVILLGRYYFKK